MSSKSTPKSTQINSFKNAFVLGLLVVHACWIIVHLNLVSRELINPWKLGGYGMYTKPSNKAKLSIYDLSATAVRVPRDTYVDDRFRRANFRYTFRCKSISEKSLLMFYRDNPHLVNSNLGFIISESKFLREPIRSKRFPHSVVQVIWPQPGRFLYSGKICGETYDGSVDFKP